MGIGVKMILEQILPMFLDIIDALQRGREANTWIHAEQFY